MRVALILSFFLFSTFGFGRILKINEDFKRSLLKVKNFNNSILINMNKKIDYDQDKNKNDELQKLIGQIEADSHQAKDLNTDNELKGL